MEFDPVGKNPLDIIERVGSLGMARNLHLLHRIQVLVRLLPQAVQLGAEDLDLVGHCDALTVRQVQKLVDLVLNFDDVTLKI